jgi:hypothetical protein
MKAGVHRRAAIACLLIGVLLVLVSFQQGLIAAEAGGEVTAWYAVLALGGLFIVGGPFIFWVLPTLRPIVARLRRRR